MAEKGEQVEEKWWEREVSLEEMAANAKVIKQTPYGVQDGNGTDVSLIEACLSVPPLVRVRRIDAAARMHERIHGRVRS